MAASTDNRSAWVALMLSFIATLAIFIPYVGYATQIPSIMKDLGINYAKIGLVESVSALTGGLSVYASGIIINRFGAKAVCIWALALSAVGQYLFAIASSFEMMIVVRALQGAVIPLLFVGPYNIALRWAEKSGRSGVFMGVMLSTDGVGSFLAAYCYSYILTSYGWRVGSMFGALVILAMAMVQWLLLREPAETGPTLGARTERRRTSLSEFLKVFFHPSVILAALFLSGAGGLYCVSVYWVPTLLLEAGWNEETAGLVGSLFPMAGIVSSIVFGILSDRLGHRKPLILLAGAGVVIGSAIATYAVAVSDFTLLAAAFPLAGLFAYGGVPLGYVLAADAVGAELAALSTGCIMGTGFLLGGMIFPFTLGLIREEIGNYTIGFAAATCALILTNVIPTFFAGEREPA